MSFAKGDLDVLLVHLTMETIKNKAQMDGANLTKVILQFHANLFRIISHSPWLVSVGQKCEAFLDNLI